MLRLLLEAHDRDATRRLSSLQPQLPARILQDVWTDTLLKAALVRIAPLELCGSEVEPAGLPQDLDSAMLSQFDDGLWDDIESEVRPPAPRPPRITTCRSCMLERKDFGGPVPEGFTTYQSAAARGAPLS